MTKLKTTAILIVSRKVFNLFHSELIVTRGKPLSRNLTTSCYSKKIKLVTRFFPNCSNTILQIFCIMQFAILYPPNLFLLGAFSETKSKVILGRASDELLHSKSELSCRACVLCGVCNVHERLHDGRRSRDIVTRGQSGCRGRNIAVPAPSVCKTTIFGRDRILLCRQRRILRVRAGPHPTWRPR